MGRDKLIQLKKCYIPLLEDETFEWRWEEELVSTVDKMWIDGYSAIKMAQFLSRDPDEVLILLIDRLRQDLIHPRKGGLLGTIT